MARDAASAGAHGRKSATSDGRQATTRKPMVVADAMAIPPMVGVGARCHRSGRGGTTAPMVGAKRRTSAPRAREAIRAIANASVGSKTVYRLTPNYQLPTPNSQNVRRTPVRLRDLRGFGGWK